MFVNADGALPNQAISNQIGADVVVVVITVCCGYCLGVSLSLGDHVSLHSWPAKLQDSFFPSKHR